MTTPETAGLRIYRIGPWRRVLMVVPFAILTLALAFFGFDRLVVGISLLSTLYLCWTAFSLRLEVSAAGLRLRDGLQTSWENMTGARLYRGAEGFVLREPIPGKRALRLAEASRVGFAPVGGRDVEGKSLVQERRFFPLAPYAWYLRHGDLAAQVDRFAPHLRIREAMAAPWTSGLPSAAQSRRDRIDLLWATPLAVILLLIIIFSPRTFHAVEIVGFLLVPAAALTAFCAVRAWKRFRHGAILPGMFWTLIASVPTIGCVIAAVKVFHVK